MSFYSDEEVQTLYFDPNTYVQPTNGNINGRVTFELDGTKLAYLPNMRLLNVGVVAGGAALYNPLVGSYVTINSIRLLDGATELSGLTNVQLYRGFLNVNSSNSSRESVGSNLSKSSVGWSVIGDSNVIGRVAHVDKANTNDAVNHTSFQGYLKLAEVFPILNSLTHLPTAVFKNLNIVIETTASKAAQVLNDISVNFSGSRPLLACDILVNPAIVNKLNGALNNARWLEVEHDRFNIPQTATNGGAADQGITQPVNVTINGFNNKHLERVVIVKEVANAVSTQYNNDVVGWGRYASQACYGQTVQFRLNGRNILPRAGITGNNERLAYVVDTYGDCVAYPSSNIYSVSATQSGDTIGDAGYVGGMDYIACYLGAYINNLQINYSRVGLESTDDLRATTQLLFAHVFGEVAKSLIVKGDNSYNIVYSQN